MSDGFAEMVSGFRAYVNKTEGNEHSRVIDMYAADEDVARLKAEGLLEADETIDQIVSISVAEGHVLV